MEKKKLLKITAKQKAARRKNIAIARKSKSKKGGTGKTPVPLKILDDDLRKQGKIGPKTKKGDHI